jgi:hypothetical protein
MSDYVPDSDRSLASIAEALERIADAQEALVEIARKPAPVLCPWRWTGPGSPPTEPPAAPWHPWPGTGSPPYPLTTWISTVPGAGGSSSSHDTV